MGDTAHQQPDDQVKQMLSSALESGAILSAKQLLLALHPAEIANILESLPVTERTLLWESLSVDSETDIIPFLSDEVQKDLVEGMETGDLVKIAKDMDNDDLADLLQNLPDQVTEKVLQVMNRQDRVELEAVLHYEEDTAGGLMNTDTVMVYAESTLGQVQLFLENNGELPQHTDSLIVKDNDEKYLGMLPLAKILTNDKSSMVADVMLEDVPYLDVDDDANKVAFIFEKRDLLSAPVVDASMRVIGRITIDDIVDVIREEAEHSLMGQVGLNEDNDIFAPVLRSSKRRALWLGINLITAFIAAAVIGAFQGTLEKIVVLAVLMPIVANMGGIAGTQTLTLVIRGIALGKIHSSNRLSVYKKELAVGIINSLVWSVVVGVITLFWFQDLKLGLIICIAMIINVFAAVCSGVTIPFILRKLSIDPAIAGGVLLTTITDVIGFLAFLGLATWFLI